MRRWLIFLITVLSYGCVAAAETPPTEGAVAITSVSVPLDPERSDVRRLGRLVYRGGLELSSGASAFGGLSGVLIDTEGERLLAVTDRGAWLQAKFIYDARGDLAGLTNARMGPLLGSDGKRFVRRAADAEALAFQANGDLLVAFEGNHRLVRYGPSRTPFSKAIETTPAPSPLAGMPRNGGMEAVVALTDGRLLAFSEELYSDGETLIAAVREGTGWQALALAAEPGFRPTDATLLPGGDVLLLERRVSLLGGLEARLRVIPAGDIKPGTRLVGRELARLGPPRTSDNFEGVAARRGRHGETLIYLLSDDNFNPLQRTLLMMFEIVGTPAE